MNRNARTFCFLVFTLGALAGCSSKPDADAKKAAAAPDKIQGKAQVLIEQGGAMDAALNAGGSSVYIWEGARRYRLFLRTPVEITHGDEYAVEGIYAQKAIDEIGDPDQGKNGYPLEASCDRVVRTVWGGIAMDQLDLHARTLRVRVQRYPARPVFLVTRIRAVKPEEGAAGAKKEDAAKEKGVPEMTLPAEKARALQLEGNAVQPAPLWEPTGGTVKCKVLIDAEGKISELETGTQLCENMQWNQFRYKPSMQGGRPVKVHTEVEVKYEARK